MLGSIRKALVGLLTPVVAYVATTYLPPELATVELQTAIVALTTAVLVYLVPNKEVISKGKVNE